jgi:A/G-specific adenine glycosylase
MSLPGIGRSTAGAILSFAYHQDAPILDGNAKRVLSRLFAVSESQGERKTEQLLWRISQSLIPKGFSNPFNQALMDLGSTICTPKNPLCLHCPIKNICKGYRLGEPERFPSRVVKKRIPHIEAVTAVIEKGGKVLLKQRAAKGFLGGLWEFPNWRLDGGKDLTSFLRAKVKSDLGLKVKWKDHLGTFKQTYSHFKLTLQVFDCEHLNGKGKGKWVPIKNLGQLAMSRIHRRIADSILSKLK